MQNFQIKFLLSAQFLNTGFQNLGSLEYDFRRGPLYVLDSSSPYCSRRASKYSVEYVVILICGKEQRS